MGSAGYGKTMSTVLETHGLGKTFAGFVAVQDLHLGVEEGARHALIGPNGAGKTTLINLLSGFLEPTSGEVFLAGENITRLAQHKRVKRGLVRTFQLHELFADFTVLESLTLAVSERLGLGWRCWRAVGAHSAALAEAAALLAELQLADVADEKTRTLSYGKQRLLEIALALAARPRVLLLDEPAAGVPTSESRELYAAIARLPRSVAVLLIEHDMDLVFRFADRITVLAGGALIAEGSPRAIAKDPRVREVYLGPDYAASNA